MLNSSLLPRLVCPETKQHLTVADAGLVSRLNEDIQAGRLKFASGEPVPQRLDGGLLREDGLVLYPIVQGIPHLTADQAVSVDEVR